MLMPDYFLFVTVYRFMLEYKFRHFFQRRVNFSDLVRSRQPSVRTVKSGLSGGAPFDSFLNSLLPKTTKR